MTITFVGNEIPQTKRIITGFTSLDKALAGQVVAGPRNKQVGFPVRTLTEIYGPEGIGKSTFMATLGGIFGRELGCKRIDFADLEGQSLTTIENSLLMGGYSGEVNMLRNAKTLTHEDILDGMIADLQTKECGVAMLDSVGAFAPIAEVKGSVADAAMGQKARVIGNWARKIIATTLHKEIMVMYVSHQHSNIGIIPGTHTSGGETKKFLNSVQISLKRTKEDHEIGWLLEGKIRKNRYGQGKRSFRIFIVGGMGAHVGLSAVFDCVAAGLAQIERKVVTMEDYTYGKVTTLIDHQDDAELFAPFIHAALTHDISVTTDEDEEEDDKDTAIVDDEPEIKAGNAAEIMKKVASRRRGRKTKAKK